jgi:hypothetical protein
MINRDKELNNSLFIKLFHDSNWKSAVAPVYSHSPRRLPSIQALLVRIPSHKTP